MENSESVQWDGGPPDPIIGLRASSIMQTYMHDISEDSTDESSVKSIDDTSYETSTLEDVDEGVNTEQEKVISHQMRKSLMKKGPKNEPPARERPMNDKWPVRQALTFTRALIFYGDGYITKENEIACKCLLECRDIRQKYHEGKSVCVNENFDSYVERDEMTYAFGKDGVAELRIKSDSQEGENLVSVPNIDEFISDYNHLMEVCNDGAIRSFSFRRLQMLSTFFKLHNTSNGMIEDEAQSNLLGADFYRTMKVDNHIHLAAASSAKQFVHFVKTKLETESDTIVHDGKTLGKIFEDAGLDYNHLTVDAFDVMADYSVYQRFDNFNDKYSPFRMANLRKIFLKVNNDMNGRYFAEMTKNVFASFEASKGHVCAAEMRLSIYGMERYEWLQLAKWVLTDWSGINPGPVLSARNRWLIQIPRLWRIYYMKGKAKNESRCFQEMLENIFCPMFDATLYPDKHPEIAELLKHVVGFDSVDDEGASEMHYSGIRPSEWKDGKNPAYGWQLYHLWANLQVLNRLRTSKGLNTFSFRPHAGETGDVMHLGAAYMLAKSINHGINLDKQVSLQYLYYLDQVGLSIAPLSNNFLFRKIKSNPFPKFFKRGLNVTLSTDDPLLFHMSDDALLEEYSVARASFDLSMTDMSEIARNSVLQSCFEDEWKKEWLGEDYKRGITFCDERKTHVPLIRAKFRAQHLAMEHMLIHLIGAGKGKNVLKEMMTNFGLARDAHRNTLMHNYPDVPAFPEQNQL